MEQKADYSKLRSVYFRAGEEEMTSHSNRPNLEAKSDALQESISLRLSEMMSSALEANESFRMGKMSGKKEFATQLSQRSQEMMKMLQEKYGVTTYSKIAQMIKNEDFSEWEQIEQELLSVPLESFEGELPTKEGTPLMMSDRKIEDFINSEDQVDTDLDYLDALVQHDYSRLKKFQTEDECIHSIFSDIIENEQKSNTNYQDDIFNKNIDLIFNSEVDLDECVWSEFVDSIAPSTEMSLDQSIHPVAQSQVLNQEAGDVEPPLSRLEDFQNPKEELLNAITQEKEVLVTKRSDKVNLVGIYLLAAGIIVLLIIAYLI